MGGEIFFSFFQNEKNYLRTSEVCVFLFHYLKFNHLCICSTKFCTYCPIKSVWLEKCFGFRQLQILFQSKMQQNSTKLSALVNPKWIPAFVIRYWMETVNSCNFHSAPYFFAFEKLSQYQAERLSQKIESLLSGEQNHLDVALSTCHSIFSSLFFGQ